MRIIGIQCAILESDYTIPRLKFIVEPLQAIENNILKTENQELKQEIFKIEYGAKFDNSIP